MMQLLRPVLILVGKDILLEWRSRDLVVSMLVFSLLIVVVFNFALNVTPQRVTVLAPGIIWVTFAFAATLAMNSESMRSWSSAAAAEDMARIIARRGSSDLGGLLQLRSLDG